MRGVPQSKFSLLICRISARNSASIGSRRSRCARPPTPIAAKAGPMPTYQRIGSNNHESRKDRRKPTIELNEEPAVVVSETSPALQLAPQDHQLMSERGILGLKPDLRLEWGGQDRHDETQEPEHLASLGDSGASSTRIKFSVHTGRGRFDPKAFEPNVKEYDQMLNKMNGVCKGC